MTVGVGAAGSFGMEDEELMAAGNEILLPSSRKEKMIKYRLIIY